MIASDDDDGYSLVQCLFVSRILHSSTFHDRGVPMQVNEQQKGEVLGLVTYIVKTDKKVFNSHNNYDNNT